MKAFNVMTSTLVAAREGSTAREIGTKLLIGNFNGLPVINSSIKVIGIVTAVDILRAIRQGKNLDSIRAIDISLFILNMIVKTSVDSAWRTFLFHLRSYKLNQPSSP
jgi:CBS domain-containing protein